MRRLLAFVSALFVAPCAVTAQQARGFVRDSAAGMPIPGVVVTVIDSAGTAGARTITDAQGRFVVSAALSAARLRFMRIGYRPRDIALSQPRDPEIKVAMERVPPILERVRVSDSELCPGSSDRGAAFMLWEQASAGLLATIVARDLKPADAKTIVYESVMSPTDEMIRRQTKSIKSGRTSRPFVSSAGPAYFAKIGYMLDDPSGRLFNAPDADVLLHESFASTHCFRLRASDTDHPGQTGLAFSPIPGRDEIVEVSGVIWVDNSAPQIRSVDFSYLSLEPAAMAARPGGHIEFRTMPNGVAFIERWHLRLPNLQAITNAVGNPAFRRASTGVVRRQDRIDLRVAEIIEAGGIVVEAKWADGTSWVDTPAMISGVVTRRKTNGPVADAVITLVGTVDTTVTDNAGEFELHVIPGRYLVTATDTSLQAFVKPRTESVPVLAQRASVAATHLELAPIGETIADVCRGQPMRDSAVVLVGYAAMADATSLSGTRVHASWQADFTQTAAGVAIHRMDQDADVDNQGRFVVCGPARDRPVSLRLFKGSNRLADTTVRVMPVGFSQQVVWRIAPLAITAESALLEGTILNAASKTPISGAEVAIPLLQRAATTGDDGSFRLAGIPPGTYAVQVRHVGDEPFTDSIHLEPKARVTRSFTLRRATVLDTMRTRASAVSANLRLFEAHRATRQGAYVTDSTLRLRTGQRLADFLLQHVQDLRIWRTGKQVYVVAPSSGRVLSGFRNASRCISTVFVDGDMQWDIQQLGNVLPFSIGEYWTDDLAAVEYYGPSAPLPAEYRRTRSPCGTLVLWTRQK